MGQQYSTIFPTNLSEFLIGRLFRFSEKAIIIQYLSVTMGVYRYHTYHSNNHFRSRSIIFLTAYEAVIYLALMVILASRLFALLKLPMSLDARIAARSC